MLDEALRVVARSLSPELAPPEALEPLEALAARLPDALTHHFGFECRLGAGPSPVDLVLLVTKGDERRILAGTDPHIHLPDDFSQHPAWRRVQAFARLWDDPGTPLHARVGGAWLEFDADRVAGGVPVPGVFFDVDEVDLDAAPASLPPAPDPAWITDLAMPAVRGEPLPPALRQAVRACFDQARGRARVLQVGLFPARGVDAVRLFVYPFPGMLAEFLEAAGWPGGAGEAASTAAALGGLTDHLYLDVDVGPAGLLPRIGIECHFRDYAQPVHEPRWPRLLDWLAERGLCTPARRDALLEFPGVVVEDFFYSRAFYRGLHHVKLVLHPGRPLEAKAYLGAKHRPAGWMEERAGAATAAVAAV